MSNLEFSKEDLAFIGEKGIPVETIETQVENFRNGFPPMELVAAATPGNGIMCHSEKDIRGLAERYEKLRKDLQVIKFVPASGAASRMFKKLFEFINEKGPSDPVNHPAVLEFIDGLEKLALTPDLQQVLIRRGTRLEALLTGKDYRSIVETVLLEGGLNYGQLPKGLIRFHRYEQEYRTSVEEHLVEGATYGRGADGKVMLHFTVSSEHLDGFIDLLGQKQSAYEERFDVSYQIDFSIQRSFTDTISVDMKNVPFRDPGGKLLFRPGGHGALLANLNELDAELVFIKNIDNVSPDRLKPVTFLYKKALAGVLLEYRQKIFGLLRDFENAEISDRLISDAETLLGAELNNKPFPDYNTLSREDRIDYLRRKLNRPLRVCGMVRNEGEPGGGPFWARNSDGSVSLQVVEASQINLKDPVQAEIVASSTHFNPVDLVCSIRNHKGEPFNLNRFIDPYTGFISKKSRDGRNLKAQELPGLWNGSMADWNTIFVEVPIETFNPVKTINDLLRPQHIAWQS